MNQFKNTTDYNDCKNWMVYESDPNRSVDIFYLYPTAYFKNIGESDICSVDHEGMRTRACNHVINKGSAFETVGNYFVPFYRQASIECLVNLNEENAEELINGPIADTIAAFDYYIQNYNNGRPFILAGHSQGSILLSILLGTYFKKKPELIKSMVAAYIVGFGITEKYLAENSHLSFASGESDYGVIISYNTEAPGMNYDNITVPTNSIVINPVSWTLDEELAPASLSKGSRLVSFNEDTNHTELIDKKQFADAKVDRKRGVVVCSTADPKNFRIKGGEQFFPLGILHNGDYPLYYYDLRENAKKRTNSFLKD